MKVYVKIYESLQGKILTLCDKNLIGKTFEDNGVKLEINDFYKGELWDLEQIKNIDFDNISCIHAIGDDSIRVLEELKIINQEDKKKIKYVKNVPILLIFYV